MEAEDKDRTFVDRRSVVLLAVFGITVLTGIAGIVLSFMGVSPEPYWFRSMSDDLFGSMGEVVIIKEHVDSVISQDTVDILSGHSNKE